MLLQVHLWCRAANGVIVITTKRDRKVKLK